jgi:hypothetical protein
MSTKRAPWASNTQAPQPDGKLRRSQLITAYGPGAMVDLVADAVVIGGLDFWQGDGMRGARTSRGCARASTPADGARACASCAPTRPSARRRWATTNSRGAARASGRWSFPPGLCARIPRAARSCRRGTGWSARAATTCTAATTGRRGRCASRPLRGGVPAGAPRRVPVGVVRPPGPRRASATRRAWCSTRGRRETSARSGCGAAPASARPMSNARARGTAGVQGRAPLARRGGPGGGLPRDPACSCARRATRTSRWSRARCPFRPRRRSRCARPSTACGTSSRSPRPRRSRRSA